MLQLGIVWTHVFAELVSVFHDCWLRDKNDNSFRARGLVTVLKVHLYRVEVRGSGRVEGKISLRDKQLDEP